MKKYINKINGYINSYGNPKLFKGKLLLDDEGWLEGIITFLNNDSIDEKSIIFGPLYDEKVIELFGLRLTGNNSALNFHAEKQSEYYDGQVLTISDSNQQLYGLCNLIIRKYTPDSKDISIEIEKLEAEIENFKNNMDLYGKTFYNETIRNKDRITKVVIDSYNVNSDIKKLLKKFKD